MGFSHRKGLVAYKQPYVEDECEDGSSPPRCGGRRSSASGESCRKNDSAPQPTDILAAAGSCIVEYASSGLNSKLQKLHRRTAGLKKISPEEFNRAITKITDLRNKKRFDDKAFDQIAEVCIFYGQEAWAELPRTFTILEKIGCRDAIDGFVSAQLSDFYLPYTERNLPDVVKGAEARQMFLEVQDLVITPQAIEVTELESDRGRHQHFLHSADDWYTSLGELGMGRYGQVDQVWSKISRGPFARKRIRRGQSIMQSTSTIEKFEQELARLKQIQGSHRHLVKLVGSYTDPTWVGLLMEPIADMNLYEFFVENLDERHRKTCLRRFFGCLASAVLHLHKMKIRHKDIKPQNILVKGSSVYLTDFGTSRAWEEESGSTTSGFTPYTPLYCSPEVADGDKRNELSDIWSLGCVYLEMISVLCGKTPNEMSTFFEENGTGASSIRSNEEAATLWMDQLRSAAKSTEDKKVLDLIAWMTQRLPKQRPTAQQVFNSILNFGGNQLCGACCLADSPNPTLTIPSAPMSSAVNPSTILASTTTPPIIAAPTVTPRKGILKKKTQPAPSETFLDSPPQKLLAIPPDSDDALDGNLSDQSTVVDLRTNTSSEDESSHPKDSTANKKVNNSPKDAPKSATVRFAVTEHPFLQAKKAADGSHLRCQWPNCVKFKEEFSSVQLLNKHYLLQHEVHGLGWSQLLRDSKTKPFSEDPELQANDKNALVQWTDSSPSTAPDPEETELETDNARFINLPSNKRPPPAVREYVPDKKEQDPFNYIPPQPLELPSLGSKLELPESTIAPSYLLAGSNRFSNFEVNEFLNSPGSNGCVPLFVYGTLMFPSILRAFAQSTIATGIYASEHQTRVKPTAKDWADMNVSLTHVCENTTPAALSGFNVWRPSGLDCGALLSAKHTPQVLNSFTARGDKKASTVKPSNLAQGYLVFGVKEEAIKALDQYGEFSPSQSRYREQARALPDIRESFAANEVDDDDNENRPPFWLFRRSIVRVEIELKNGTRRAIEAQTYIWDHDSLGLEELWDLNFFVRTPVFKQLSTWGRRSIKPSSEQPCTWEGEEKSLASSMKLRYVLPGDALVDAVLRSDIEQTSRLLKTGMDPNAKCEGFGSVLQIAAIKGDEDIARLLIEWRANVNSGGGKYHTPLLAAILNGHEDIVHLLLRNGAKANAPAGKLVSPIYQAVKSAKPSIVAMLLERGAWLDRGYTEYVELAYERGSDSITELLHTYDVRDLRRLALKNQKRLEDKERSPRSKDVSRSGANTVAVLKHVVNEWTNLRGTRGKWTGIKGVRVLRAAVEAGAGPDFLKNAELWFPLIAPTLSSFSRSLKSRYPRDSPPSPTYKQPRKPFQFPPDAFGDGSLQAEDFANGKLSAEQLVKTIKPPKRYDY